ncbi:MAG: GGDEF domain-containing protein [Acidobacteria bacterium]|nr:GGDEF domain-containing protein [Acidobacteriota bacterium]
MIRKTLIGTILLVLLLFATVSTWRLPAGFGGSAARGIWLVGILVGIVIALVARLLFARGATGGKVAVGTGRSEELSELSEEVANLNEASTLQFLLTNRLTAIVGWKSAALFLLDEEKSRYLCVRSCGDMTTKKVEQLQFKRTETFFQDVFENRNRHHDAALRIQGASLSNPQMAALIERHGFTHFVPLVNQSRLLGFLLVAGLTRLEVIQEQLLRAVVSQAAATADALMMRENQALDLLTGFMKPAFFELRMEEEMRRSRRLRNAFSVLLLDIDELKAINDRWGDQAGDDVIRTITVAVRDKLRKTDLACRRGGEEFAVLLPDTGSDQARIVAENLRGLVEGLRIRLDQARGETGCTVSIGIAEHNPDEPTFGDAILQKAQQALIQAKTRGKNSIAVYDASLPL